MRKSWPRWAILLIPLILLVSTFDTANAASIDAVNRNSAKASNLAGTATARPDCRSSFGDNSFYTRNSWCVSWNPSWTQTTDDPDVSRQNTRVELRNDFFHVVLFRAVDPSAESSSIVEPIYNCIAQAIPDFIDVYSLSAEKSADGKPLYSLAGRSYADSDAWIVYNIKGRLYFIATPGPWNFDSMQTGRDICMIADSAPDVKTFTKRFDELGTLLQAIRT